MSNPIKTAEANPYLTAGNSIHFLEAITLHQSRTGLGGGYLATRGDTVVLTQDLIELNGFLRLVGDDDAQMDRWSKVIVRPGAWPGGLSSRPGERHHEEQREEARLRAHAIEDPALRKAAIAEVSRVFGPQPTSRETARYLGGHR